MKHRSHSLEQLALGDLDLGKTGVASASTPQHSPSIPRTWSKNKIGHKRSVEPDSDSIGEGVRRDGVCGKQASGWGLGRREGEEGRLSS